MTLASMPYYWFECDWPECKAKSSEGGEYSAWSDEGLAADEAANSDWVILNFWHRRDIPKPTEPTLAYCSEHTHWDDEKDERVPGPDPDLEPGDPR